MKKTHLIAAAMLLLATSLTVTAGNRQPKGYYTKPHTEQAMKEARQWLASGEWRQGFTAASPDESVNIGEFYQQYQKNPTQWKALFEWLSKTDLLALSKGRHPIPGTTMTASVEDDVNGPLETRRSESHFHHIDFQYVVKGTERFGIIDHYTSKANCAYKPDVIHYDYLPEKTRFIDSKTDKFLIFFPCDWHIAKVQTDKADQHIRVVVIKVDYID